MCDQGMKAVVEVVAPTDTPAIHAPVPPNVAELAQEIRKDEYPEELFAFVSALFEICARD